MQATVCSASICLWLHAGFEASPSSAAPAIQPLHSCSEFHASLPRSLWVPWSTWRALPAGTGRSLTASCMACAGHCSSWRQRERFACSPGKAEILLPLLPPRSSTAPYLSLQQGAALPEFNQQFARAVAAGRPGKVEHEKRKVYIQDVLSEASSFLQPGNLAIFFKEVIFQRWIISLVYIWI